MNRERTIPSQVNKSVLVETWVRRLADEFWAAAGRTPGFPRDLEEPALWALPLVVVRLPRLDLAAARDYLARNHFTIHSALLGPNRALHGCLVVNHDGGIIFLDATDQAEEQRVTLAHEIAHYLADYRTPRARVEQRLGLTAMEVLDGRRPATTAERVTASLLGVSLAPVVHLLERGPGGDVARAFVDGSERRAQRLALELLAPADAVDARLRATGHSTTGPGLVQALVLLLTTEFGLPETSAWRDAHNLAGPAGESSAREWLGLTGINGSEERMR